MIEAVRTFALDRLMRVIRRGRIVNEHFVPTQGLELAPYLARGDVTAVHHLVRYGWAGEVLATLPPVGKLLDVACGSGYGSYLLAQRFPSATILGVDYDKTAVQTARTHYALPNLRFATGDVLLWEETIGAETFDCIVSFETLEHCRHREIMLQNMTAHLATTGTLLLSTPSGWQKPRLRPRWHHHAIEYSPATLYDFLARYFTTIRRPEEADFPGRTVFDLLHGSKVTYDLRMNPVICQSPIVIENPYLG